MTHSHVSRCMLTPLPVLFVLFILMPARSPLLAAGAVSGQVDLMSAYVWRGWDRDPKHQPVLQPSLTYALGDSGFSANLWTSISSVDRDLHETNVTLSYDFKVSENIALSAGFIHYAWYLTRGFRFRDNTTHEFYFSAALPKAPFSPGVSVYYDFDNGDGFYARASLFHSIRLSPGITADLSSSLGYNDGLWLDDEVGAGFSDLNAGIAFPIKVGAIILIPSANYTIVLIDQISEENHFWAGVSIAF
ncbi:MAG: hypothetical protein GY940_45055 [bacterium]|nr:hypothetical protein [bacterium]